MDGVWNDYLKKVDKCLKPMSVAERTDIVAEIKSEISELEKSGKGTDEILVRLGNPKDLAKAYLGEAISKNHAFSWKKIGSVVAFYSLAGTVGMFLLPVTSILGITFLFCGVIIPVAGVVKLIAYAFGYDITNIQFVVGSFSADAIMFFVISIVSGLLFFFAGKLLWFITIQLIKGMSLAMKKMKD